MNRTSSKTQAAAPSQRRRRTLACTAPNLLLSLLLTSVPLAAGAQAMSSSSGSQGELQTALVTEAPDSTASGSNPIAPPATGEAAAQTPAQTPAQSTSQTTPQTASPSTSQTTPPTATTRTSSAKLNLAPIATYDNRWEVYGGIGFMNGQAGQALPKRFNMATAEAMGTYWLTSHLGVAGDYRFAGGTTPVLSPYYNRVAIYEHLGMGGVQWRGPKGRYAAIDYHGLVGVSHGIFDTAIKNYPGGSPVTAAQVGLYTNRTSFHAALGGSVDFNYTKNLAIRLQPDLILEHFGSELREFVAISGGVVYRFGKR